MGITKAKPRNQNKNVGMSEVHDVTAQSGTVPVGILNIVHPKQHNDEWILIRYRQVGVLPAYEIGAMIQQKLQKN